MIEKPRHVGFYAPADLIEALDNTGDGRKASRNRKVRKAIELYVLIQTQQKAA